MRPEFPSLEPFQKAIAEAPSGIRTFLSGHTGTGKTSAGVARLLRILANDSWSESVLVLVPQRSLGEPYLSALQYARSGPERVRIQTLAGLARRSIELFWPLLAEEAGFHTPSDPPTFLTIETAQYFMAKAIEDLLTQGYLEGVRLRRNRLYSQILDNLNKAAGVGFPYWEFGERLSASWVGDAQHRLAYSQAQECANRFRKYCLAHNLLDFSLQLEVFVKHLWDLPLFQDYLLGQGLHLIVDNIEEDTPTAHDLLLDLLPKASSALVIHDLEGGHRTFLGADPKSALRLRDACTNHVEFDQSFSSPDEVRLFGRQLARAMGRLPSFANGDGQAGRAISFTTVRYSHLVTSWAADEIASLLGEGVPPSEIVVLAPFMPDVLRFTLEYELGQRNIPYRSHRPSRALKDEPATRTLLLLAKLAHPAWQRKPLVAEDVSRSLMHAIGGMDLVRAHLLTTAVLNQGDPPRLLEFERLPPALQTRVSFVLGERYERLRTWLAAYAGGPLAELDHFIARLFGEVLSQPGFGFHRSLDAGRTTAVLIESIRKFRDVAQPVLSRAGIPLGQEYMAMVEEGVIAAAYFEGRGPDNREAVLLSPAFTFLMRNQPVDYQFWLGVNSNDWSRRIYQPLTHPYVLSRQWQRGRPWLDSDEETASQDALYRLTQGLVRRCRKKIYLGFSDVGPHGWEERGPLMRAIQKVLLGWSKAPEVRS